MGLVSNAGREKRIIPSFWASRGAFGREQRAGSAARYSGRFLVPGLIEKFNDCGGKHFGHPVSEDKYTAYIHVQGKLIIHVRDQPRKRNSSPHN